MIQTNYLIQKLNGLQTIETIMDALRLKKQEAIYYVHRLRKEGFVKTKKLSNNKRIYDISIENKLKGTSYSDILNQNSPVKVIFKEKYIIYGKKPSIEETIVFSVKTKSLRIILSALALFRKIKNWNLLYKLAKKDNLVRIICALYDLARIKMKVKKIPKFFKKKASNEKNYANKYIINDLKSKDFQKIEKKWKIYIPFNNEDLEVYAK